jgi:hypothetical protein
VFTADLRFAPDIGEVPFGNFAEGRDGILGGPMGERILAGDEKAAQLVALLASGVERDIAEWSQARLPPAPAVAVHEAP